MTDLKFNFGINRVIVTGESLIVVSFFSMLLLAMVSGPVEGKTTESYKLSTTAPDTLYLRTSDTTSFELTLRIDTGWHINTNNPRQDYLIPTKVQLKDSDFILRDVNYPSGKEYSFSFSTERLLVYSGKTSIGLTVRPGPTSEPGHYRENLRLTYQPCSDKQCLRPNRVTVPVDLVIKDS